jgi:glucose-1-phosphate thymidylyltransferase
MSDTAKMKAIIPVAGGGKRLRPFTVNYPKALLQCADRPVLGHILRRIEKLGVREVILVTGEHTQMIQDYAQAAFSALSVICVQQQEALGLGHAVWTAREAAAGAEELLIIYGDSIIDAELPRDAGWELAIGVLPVREPANFGVVVVDGENIMQLVEKPAEPVSNLAIAGMNIARNPAALFGALDELVAENKRTRGEIQLTDAFEKMLENGHSLHAFRVQRWLDCGNPEGMLEANRLLLQRLAPVELEGSDIKPPVFIAPDAKVEKSRLGPCVAIATGAEVRACTLSDCIVNAGAKMHGVTLANTIIGPGEERG